jgi:hypothetical protein
VGGGLVVVDAACESAEKLVDPLLPGVINLAGFGCPSSSSR